MSFERVIDSAALDATVTRPFEDERESRNVATPLMESDAVSVAYFPATTRTGEFVLRFPDYEEADDARTYFLAASLYDFLGPATTAGEYIISDGLVVLSAGEPDPARSFRFAVIDRPILRELLGAHCELRVPYREVPA